MVGHWYHLPSGGNSSLCSALSRCCLVSIQFRCWHRTLDFSGDSGNPGFILNLFGKNFKVFLNTMWGEKSWCWLDPAHGQSLQSVTSEVCILFPQRVTLSFTIFYFICHIGGYAVIPQGYFSYHFQLFVKLCCPPPHSPVRQFSLYSCEILFVSFICERKSG